MEEIMNKLKELMDTGFTEYEARVYSSLVYGDALSANDITRTTGVPRGRVYDILNSLLEDGFCIMIPGTVKKFQAVAPELAFESILERQRAREQSTRRVIEKLQSAYQSEESNKSQLDCLYVYSAKATIAKKSNEFIEQTKEIHRSLCKPPYITIDKIEDLEEKAEPVIKALESGKTFKSIYEIEADNMENFLRICSFFQSHGEQVRVMKKIPIKLIIKDKTCAMFTLFHESLTKNNITSMYLEHSDVVYALIDLFEYYWSKAIPFEEFDPVLLERMETATSSSDSSYEISASPSKS